MDPRGICICKYIRVHSPMFHRPVEDTVNTAKDMHYRMIGFYSRLSFALALTNFVLMHYVEIARTRKHRASKKVGFVTSLP